MAWHNRTGRGTANWILRAHYSDIDGNVEQFAYLTGATLYGAAIFGVLYLALEPWVRRDWPQVLVTWTRVLRGDFKSPQVGRDALIGAALGVLFITWIAVMQLFVLKIGEQGPEGFYLGNLLGFRYSLGIFINYFGNSIASLTTFLVFGFFLRIILRKEWLVAVLFVVLGALFQASGTEVLFWQVFAVDIGIYALLMVALIRFGLFASVVMLFVTNTLGDGLATTHLSAWYGTSTWLSILLVMTVAIWGYFVAVAGQPLLGAPEKLEPARYNR